MSALFYKDKYITGPLRILLDEIRSETAFPSVPDTSPVPVIPAETLDRIHIYVKLYERPYIRDKVPPVWSVAFLL